MPFCKVGLCIFLIQAILLITCQGSEEETVYGTFGVITNFKDRTLDLTNITSWKVTAPLDHTIVITVIYPSKKGSNSCKNFLVKDVNTKTDISSSASSTNRCRFHSRNRTLSLQLTGKFSFLALFEAFRKEINVTASYPVSDAGFITKAYNYTMAETVPCHQLKLNSISVENRTMNYFFRAFLMSASDNIWINTSNTAFTSWESDPNSYEGCAKMSNTGKWESVGANEVCYTGGISTNKHICEQRVSPSSTFYDRCKESLGIQQGKGITTDDMDKDVDVRLYKGDWISSKSTDLQWIKVVFPKTYIMTGVATQGVESVHGWVISFSISFQGLNSSGMIPLKNARNKSVVFKANTDPYNVAFNRIEPVIVTKAIRLNVKDWHKEIALRMELYGCEVHASSCGQCNLGMENNAIKDEQITSSSSYDNSKYPRLNLDLRSADKKSCWSTSEQQSPWLQVDLKSRYYITAVLTQGCGDDNIHEWVKKYEISYGDSTNQMVEYKVNGSLKEFDGNTDRSSIKVNHLNPIIVTQKIRIFPTAGSYHNNISMRIELQGCYFPNPGFELLQMKGWGAWSECNATCNGTRQRNRACNVVPDGQCKGQVEYESCDRVNFCKNFSAWSTWTACSNSCGPGEQRRSRIFTGSYQGKSCSGRLTVVRDCNGTCNITYGNWSEWNKCNMTCGIGFQERTRNCTTQKINQTCGNGSTEIRICNISYPDLGSPGPWSPWSVCNETCGIYSQTRKRNMSHSNNQVLYEEISSRECKPCLPCMCFWSNWTECSCSAPNQTRTRNCSSTEAGHLNCSGTTVGTRPCNQSCPVDGNFTNWSNWTSCSLSCGYGTQYRNRSCSEPAPSNGGKNCSGNSSETRNCTIKPCPVNGNFTNWSNWTSCTVTCGNGTQLRNRSCTKPLPAHGGNNCTGRTNETQICNTHPCPINGNFTNWSNWTSCSLTCGNGTRHRNRSCTKPVPAHGGKNCTGPYNETQICEGQPCPVDGNFTNWSNWTSCSVTCGNGTHHRNRSCTKPLPAHGGNNCTGRTNETKICQKQPCPVNGNFSSWSSWTPCTLTCGNGTRERTRNCTNPSPAHGGKNCSDRVREKQNCNTQSCPKIPVDGGFTSWGDWSKCTLTCGTGSQQRERTCTNPPPANNGDNCTGEFIEKKICNTNKCPIDGKWTSWSAWSDCNRPCGNGSEIRTRTCSSPPPQYGGNDCVGENSESQNCLTGNKCPAATISVIARFTNETYSEELKKPQSTESQDLRNKILNNLRDLYVDPNIVEDIEVKSFSNGSVVANFDIKFKKMDSTQLIILQESIEVKKMLNAMPLQTSTINATKVPNERPNVTLKVLSSTSVHAKWTMIDKSEYNSDKLKGYSVFYKEDSQDKYSLEQMVPFESPSIVNATIKELKKYTYYTLRVLAYTDKGNGISSDPVSFRTDEDVPSRSPETFTVTPTSSTALMTRWKAIPNEYHHGKLLGYRIIALNTKTGANKTYEPGQHRRDTDITGLDKFAEYSVTICGFTSKGCGFTTQQTTSTLEDLPSLPPKDPVATSFLSTSEIEIRWEPVPHEGRNGIIREYIINYNLHSQAQSRVFETKTFTERVKPSVHKLKIGGLRPYSKYEFRIAARNTKGVGPFQKLYGETCRCPREIFSNYWFVTPYFNSTSSGQVTGIFSHIVEKMLKWSCGDCKNGHRETVVNFQKDGNGSKALKKSILGVAGNVDNGAQISFPINGNKDMNRIYGNQVFVPVVESPGIAYLVIPIQSSSTAMKVFNSIISSLPFVLFSLGLAYLAGVVIWFLDASHTESVFPTRFSKGVFEGLWWSFISMTTVGYGDRSPVSFMSRWFAILWTLYGMTLVSILTSTMSSSLTTESLQIRTSIYGTQIAAIQNSSEHRIGILKNGKVNQVSQYHSVSDILDALHAREVKGALIDTYVVAAKSQKFTDAGIRVAKMLDRPFGYGLVLSSEIAMLESECFQYLHTKAESITRLIEISTQKLTVPSLADSNTRDTKLFDASSILFQNTLIFVSSLLGLAVLCGLVWHYTCHKKTTKVSPITIEMLSQKELTVQKMRAFVDKFHQQAMSKMKEMRAKHQYEKLKLYRRIKERKKEMQKVEKAQAKAARLKDKTEDPDGMYSLSDLVKLATNMVRS